MRKKSETFEKKLVKTKLVKTKLVKVLGQITQRWTKISEFQFFVRLLLRTQDTQVKPSFSNNEQQSKVVFLFAFFLSSFRRISAMVGLLSLRLMVIQVLYKFSFHPYASPLVVHMLVHFLSILLLASIR